MKTVYSLTLCSLLFLILSFGCNRTKPTPSPNADTDLTTTTGSVKDGPYSKNDEDGKLLEKGTIKNGVPEGKRTVYYPNGKVRTEELYVKGNYQGPFKEYFDNGKLMQEGQYDNNVMTGIWKTYYETGELKEEVTFSDNNENGPFKTYYKSGKVKWEGVYKDGDNEEGELKLYNEAGELIKKKDCVHGDCNTIFVKKGYEDVKD